MLTIEELKKSIENKSFKMQFMIFKYSDNDFLPMQYIHHIRGILDCDVEFVEKLLNSKRKIDIFSTDDKVYSLKILCCDSFIFDNKNLQELDDTIVVCKKIDKSVLEFCSDYVIEFPKLENWHIKDYAYSLGSGIDKAKLDTLIDICNNDIYRLDKELKKISIFDERFRENMFNSFIDDGIFDDMSKFKIFDITNAIIKKDVKTLFDIYQELDSIDCEPVGLVTILYNNFKNILAIQFNQKASPESLGIDAKKFYAIKKYNCGFYTRSQLVNILQMLMDIDYKLKSGLLPADLIIDYVITKIFSFS